MAAFTSLARWLAGKESRELSPRPSAGHWCCLEDSWPSGPREDHQHRLEKAGRLPLASRGKKAFASQPGHQFATWPCASHSPILGLDSSPVNWRWWCFTIFLAHVFFTCDCLTNVSTCLLPGFMLCTPWRQETHVLGHLAQRRCLAHSFWLTKWLLWISNELVFVMALQNMKCKGYERGR